MPITKATASSIAPAAKGDLVVGSATNDAAVLGVGSNDQVLTADSSTATGLKWATASSGGMTLLNSGGTTLSGSSVTISSIAGTYKNLLIMIRSPKPSSAGSTRLRFNSDTGSNYNYVNANVGEGLATSFDAAQISWYQVDTGTATGLITAIIYDYANSSTRKVIDTASIENSQVSATTFNLARNQAYWNNNDAITSVTVLPSAGSWTSGTLFIYGVS